MSTDRETTPEDQLRESVAVALAAFSICESLVIALVDKGLLAPDEVDDAIRAAIDRRLRAEPAALSAAHHRDAVRVMETILT